MGWVASVLPAAIAAGASFFGGERTNRQNIAEAQKNRAFQERMRNTEWQAAVEDMRKAGINPALAYSHGGASSPGGSQATVDDSVGKGVSSALQTKMMQEQIKLLQAQTGKTLNEQGKIAMETEAIGFQNMEGAARRNYFFAPDGTPNPRFVDIMRSEAATATGLSRQALAKATQYEFSAEQQKALTNLITELGAREDIGAIIAPLILSFIGGRY